MRLREQSWMKHLWLACAVMVIAWTVPPCSADDFADWAGTHENLLAEGRLVPECDHPLVILEGLGGEHKFCLDSSMTRTVIDASLRSRLGRSVGSGHVNTESAELPADAYADPRLVFGDLRLRCNEPLCIDLSPFSESTGHQFAGFLGLDALERYVVELDIAGERLRVFRSLPADVKCDSEGFRMTRSDSGWSVSVPLASGKSHDFLLASGSAEALQVAEKTFDALRVANEIRECREAGQFDVTGDLPNTVRGRVRQFRIGRFSHNNLWAVRGASSYLGRDYFRRYVAVFDFAGRRLYLRPSKQYNAPERRMDMSGLILIVRNNQILVERTIAGSAAHEAGVRGEDRLTDINGQSVAGLSLDKIRKILTHDGKEVEIRVKRGEETIARKLTLREYRQPAPPLDAHKDVASEPSEPRTK